MALVQFSDGPIARVVLYSAQACHLCDRARGTIAAVRAELDFELTEVDITGDPELERRYRELLPVVEIDGRRVFVFHVPEDALRRSVCNDRLETKDVSDPTHTGAQTSPSEPSL